MSVTPPTREASLAAGAPPAPGTPSVNVSVEDSNKANWDLVAELVGMLPLVGKPFALLVRQRRARWLLIGGFLFFLGVVLPLLFPLLAAIYINFGLLGDQGQNWYAEKVVSAFRVRESAVEVSNSSNLRLDYFQVIEFVGDATDPREYSISLEPYQKARFVVERATLRTTDPVGCPIPVKFIKPRAELMKLKLFDTVDLLSVVNAGVPVSYELSVSDWDKVNSNMDKTNRAKIVLQPVKELLELTCNAVQIDLRVSVEVFKDILHSSQTSNAALRKP